MVFCFTGTAAPNAGNPVHPTAPLMHRAGHSVHHEGSGNQSKECRIQISREIAQVYGGKDNRPGAKEVSFFVVSLPAGFSHDA
jgi:hypothetical protein